MVKRVAVALCASALLASVACSTKASSSTLGVQVDAKTDAFNLQTFAYFPDKLTAHPGDSIDFTSVYRGEPHTVTFGALVDADLTKGTPNGPPPAEDAKLPNLLPNGPGDANQSAAQPCFLATGAPPASAACSAAQQTQPAFDGTQTYYNLGFLGDGASSTLKLADTIKPGTYRFMCMLHRQGMTGTVTVVKAADKADTASDVSKRKDDEIAALVSALQPLVTSGNANAKQGRVSAGLFDQKIQNAQPVQFFPKDTTTTVGGSVTWQIFGAHSVSFNAPQSATPPISKAPDGAVHLNATAFGPANSAPSPGGPNGVQKPTPFDGGSWNGQGFHSTGIIISFPPGVISYTLKFTTAGTYSYKCLVHPDMEGTVKVG